MRDIWLTAFAPILWGTTYLITTEFLPPNHPLLAAAVRALPIGIIITLYCRKYPRGHWWWRSLVLGTLNIGLFFALLFIAAYRLPGGVVATVGALQPILVMLLTWLIFSEKPPKLAIGAGALGVIGVLLLVFDASAELDTLGVLAAIGAALSTGAGIVLTKRWNTSVELLPFTGWQLVAGGLVLLPIALTVEAPLTSLSFENVAGYVWLGLVNTGLAYGLWFRGIKRLSPFQIAFLGLFSSIVAVLMGYIFLGQTFGYKQWLGIGLILASIGLAQVAQYLRTQRPQMAFAYIRR